MIKKILSRLFSRQSREQIIEDPRFRENEIGTKLMGWNEQRADFPHMIHEGNNAENELQRELARERHEMIMAGRDRKYVSEAIPAGEVERPSNPKSKEHQE